ncbi:MAG: DUF1802 family protein, partial [Cyanobacteria bacterium P01_H01_bin.58]
DLIALIRKGGIRESRPYFQVPSDRALLFPTYEHQQAIALKSPYREQLVCRPVPTVDEPILLQGWAQITHQIPILEVHSAAIALQPFHIWTDSWFNERLAWKPERPAYVLLLRAYRFTGPMALPYRKQYGGCRSWIELANVTALPSSRPVQSEADYEQQVNQISEALATTVNGLT